MTEAFHHATGSESRLNLERTGSDIDVMEPWHKQYVFAMNRMGKIVTTTDPERHLAQFLS